MQQKQAYRDHAELCLSKEKPLQRCLLSFSRNFNYDALSAVCMANRTKSVLEKISNGVCRVLWETPSKCTVSQSGLMSTFTVNEHGLTVLEETLEVEPTLFNIPSYAVRPGAQPKSTKKSQKAKRAAIKAAIVTQNGSGASKIKKGATSATVKLQKISRPLQSTSISAKLKTSRNVSNQQGRPPPRGISARPLNPAMHEAWMAAVDDRNNERKQDATYGQHVLRETGSNQFGSSPAYDDFDN